MSLCISLSSIAIVSVQSPSDSIFPSQTVIPTANEPDIDRIKSSMIDATSLVCIMLITTVCFATAARHNCMCILKMYMTFSTAMLLTLLGGNFFLTFLECANTSINDVAFFFLLGTFTISGIICIFFPDRVPSTLTQSYLMITAIIVAWNLSQLDPYTIWSLLVILVFYDIFAVLCPCGPLYQLLKSERLPEGLVYEIKLKQDRQHDEMTYSSSHKDISPLPLYAIQIEPRSSPSTSISQTPISPSVSIGDKLNDDAFSTEQLELEDQRLSPKSNAIENDSIESIKVGLGDFVFLSLMVGQGAKCGLILFFSLWISTMLVSYPIQNVCSLFHLHTHLFLIYTCHEGPGFHPMDIAFISHAFTSLTAPCDSWIRNVPYLLSLTLTSIFMQ